MKHWFYNIETKQETYSEEQPKGFIKGRLPYQFWSAERKKSYREKKASSKIVVRDLHKPASKGKTWWTNDIEEILSFDCPEGWHKGRHLVLSDEARARCASMKGKKHTEETKQKMREHNAMKRPEVAQKVSNKLKGRVISDKCIEAIKRANTFREPWNKGKKVQYSDEWYEKQKNKSYTQTDDFRLACSKRVKQLIWINNGEINKRINHLLPIPEGWERGRLNAFGRI